MMIGLKRASVLLCALLLCGGCAYRTQGSLPPHLKSVAVPIFENKTYGHSYVRGLERELTASVRQTFLTGGELRLAGREDADCILEGTVMEFRREVMQQDRFGNPSVVHLLLKARISLYDVKEGRFLFRDAVLDNKGFRSESGVFNLRFGESEAMKRQEAVDDLAKAIVRRVVEIW